MSARTALLKVASLTAENDRLRADAKELRAALEPFVRNVNAQSLSKALGHIERGHLWNARAALAKASIGK